MKVTVKLETEAERDEFAALAESYRQMFINYAKMGQVSPIDGRPGGWSIAARLSLLALAQLFPKVPLRARPGDIVCSFENPTKRYVVLQGVGLIAYHPETGDTFPVEAIGDFEWGVVGRLPEVPG